MTIYYVNQQLDLTVEDWELEDHYMSMLDNEFPEVEILGSTFGAGSSLYALDEQAFRQAYLDWIDESDWEEV